VSQSSRAVRLAELMNRHPWLRYAAAATFMSGIAARDGFVLATYPPSSASSWLTFAIGTVVAVALVTLVVRWSPPTRNLRDHPGFVILMAMSLIVIVFGLSEGLGIAPVGSPVNLGGENAAIRSFAVGAALGTVALFGLGSHRAARKARERRSSGTASSGTLSSNHD
jgi:hypothetical protein